MKTQICEIFTVIGSLLLLVHFAFRLSIPYASGRHRHTTNIRGGGYYDFGDISGFFIDGAAQVK